MYTSGCGFAIWTRPSRAPLPSPQAAAMQTVMRVPFPTVLRGAARRAPVCPVGDGPSLNQHFSAVPGWHMQGDGWHMQGDGWHAPGLWQGRKWPNIAVPLATSLTNCSVPASPGWSFANGGPRANPLPKLRRAGSKWVTPSLEMPHRSGQDPATALLKLLNC